LSIGADRGDFGHWNYEVDGFFALIKEQLEDRRKPVTFGTVDFQPHPPTLAPVFINSDQEMDLTIGSFNFRFGSPGSICLSDPISLGPSVGKAAAAAMS
jgi:hypothetical protein